MLPFKTAVLGQIAYAHSIREVIRGILKALMPGRWIANVISASDADFDAKLEGAFRSLDEHHATELEYRGQVAGVLVEEVSRLCVALRTVCENRGFRDYAKTYLSHDRFVRLVMGMDKVVMEALKDVLVRYADSPIDLLRGVGGVLDSGDKAAANAPIGPGEKMKANGEIQSLLRDVKESVENVGEKVDGLARDVRDGLGKKRPGNAYPERKVKAVLKAWALVKASEEARRGCPGTRVTYKMAFERSDSRAILEEAGVTEEEFRKILHAVSCKTSRENARRRG